ncbi:VOC family protein [Pseudoalteromonas shioyasakiensis]|uniref:VOC family protein n=1 Tax=Pseudoalteromonas shioyasakiensis TaxID=1190813 RepID=UPI0021194BC7|nr:VOC family protein [Pseudoalteromonas shioyasakiensis]MCQ8878829.1 VOC family protein [Pseudoalteromonas shioyasakiensis]
MTNLACEEIKAFVPAKNFQLSWQFYSDLGFELSWQGADIACFFHGDCSFLLQDFYNQAHAENFMMHLLVKDVDAWHQHLIAQGIAEKYQVKITEPFVQPWNIKDFVIYDPAGVLWRIGQSLDSA